MTVSYLPLMKAQQKRHDFPVHDRNFASSQEMVAVGQTARARLMGAAVSDEQASVVSAPETLDQANGENSEVDLVAPLNMLAPCSPKFLLAFTALRHGVAAQQIVGPTRKRELVAARTDAICLIYQHTQWSIPQVGNFFRRDHTTVIHALRKCGVVHKQVELLPGMASAQRPGGNPARFNHARRPRDVLVIAQSAQFPAGDKLKIKQIIDEVCAEYGISELELRSRRRAEHLVMARHKAIYRLANEAALTNREIGRAMGGKDPSLVHYAIRSHATRVAAIGHEDPPRMAGR